MSITKRFGSRLDRKVRRCYSSTMRYRILGKTNLKVSEVGLGTSKGLVEKINAPDGEKLIRRALDLGINFIDTALHYGSGEAEVRIGNAIKGRRKDVVIADKCGSIPTGKYHWSSSWRNFTPKSLELSLDASLKALQTDYIDIYQLHMASGNILDPDGNAVKTLLKFKEEGKILYTGASVDGQDMFTALETGIFDTLQVSYSIGDMYPEESGFLDRAEEENVGIIIKEPLAVAEYLRPAPEPPWMSHLWEKVRHYDYLKKNDENLPPVEITLRFVLSHPKIHTAIQATSNIRHLEENVKCSDGKGLSEKMMGMVMEAYGK